MEHKYLPLTALKRNEGQIEGLPTNPREWSKAEIERLKKSIRQTPELMEARGIIVYPHKGEYIILGGNMRYTALSEMKVEQAPCIVLPEGMPIEKLKEIVIKDNGSFGSWDYDLLANEWDELPLTDWGVPAWETKEMELTTKGRESNDDYDAFVDKFNEEQPLTTDDCYTPPVVYDLVKNFVDEKLLPLKGRKVVRPFFPGGDYTDLKQYPDDCVVIDNPPFSIYAEIVRFYIKNEIPFFLFGPQLTLFVADADACFCPFNTIITYENGAKVNTGFVTNIRKDLRIWVESTLREQIKKAQKTEPTQIVIDYPDEITTSALLGKIANGAELAIGKQECHFVRNIEGLKEIDKGLFGGGFLLARAAAERARAAAERAIKVELSPAELEIVAQLDKQSEQTNEREQHHT